MYRQTTVLPKGVSVGPQTLKELTILELVQRHVQPQRQESYGARAPERINAVAAPAPKIERGPEKVFFELKGVEDLNIGAIGGLGGRGRTPIPIEPEFYKDKTLVNSSYFTLDACIKDMLHGTLTVPDGDVTYRALRKIVGVLVRRNNVEKGMFCEEFGDRRFFSKRGGSEGVSKLVDELINQGMVAARPSFTAAPMGLERAEKANLASVLESKGLVEKGFGDFAAESVVGNLSSLAQGAVGGKITKAEILEALDGSEVIKNSIRTLKLLQNAGMLMKGEEGTFTVAISGMIVQQNDHSKDRLEITDSGLKLAADMGL